MALTKVTSGVRTIGSGEIVTASIADDAVTLAKMAAGTDGNLISYDANGDPAYVATGTTSQVLTSNGAGAAPTFQTPATPSPYGTLISTQEASTSATIDFTSLSGYDIYTLVIDKLVPDTDGGVQLCARVSTSAVFNSTTGDYKYDVQGTYTGGGAVLGTDSSNATEIRMTNYNTSYDIGNTAGEAFFGVIEVQGMVSASLFTQVTLSRGASISSGAAEGVRNEGQGYYTTAEANDGIQLFMNSGNITSGTFTLYGSNV